MRSKSATAWSTSAGDRVVYAQSTLGAYSSVHNVPADKAADFTDAISRTGGAPFLGGVDRFYLLRKTYEVNRRTLPVSCRCGRRRSDRLASGRKRWARSLSVLSVARGKSAAGAGRWRPEVINYREESIGRTGKEITGRPRGLHRGEIQLKPSLDLLATSGPMVSFARVRPVTGVNLGILNQKRSRMPRPHYRGILRDT